ncbi:hypothetical protein GCM10022226_23770 [Sphaerisporangium flaviroseum]|uniref:Cell division protein FtsL n=1 Tax=Sphaerisporangium flaviroseum TaxID=509199 RepID=A0ABP7I0A0_9ACTN
MSIDEEITQDTGSGNTTTAVGARPVRTTRAGRGAPAPSRPERTVRRAAPARPVRRDATTRPAGPPVTTAESPRRAPAGRNAPRAPFVLLVVGLLCGGLVSLLLLNTVLAQDSFRMNDLRKSTQQLNQQAQDVRTKVLLQSQPNRLDERARQQGLKQDRTAPEVLVIPPEGQRAGQAGTEAQASQAEVARP